MRKCPPRARARLKPVGVALALLGLGAIAPGATAHPGHPHAAGAGVPAAVERVAGPEVSVTRSGLYRVEIARGPDLLTHGPDPASGPAQARAAEGVPGEVGFAPGSAERPPACAGEGFQHVLYARPAGAPDRFALMKPQIQAALRRTNAALNAASIESGGPSADFKVLCDEAGEVRVDSLVTSGSSFSAVVAAAREAGFDSRQADYTIFFDGRSGGACGIASYAADETLAAENRSNQGGGYAIAYWGCWLDETPMHESAHAQGAVQYGAPNSTGSGGHCYDDLDVMCYSPDGGDLNQTGEIDRCAAIRFDCGYDDYFDSAPEPGEYLASHWNLGSSLNRFIAFGGGAAQPAEPEPPAAIVAPLRRGKRRQGVAGDAGQWHHYRLRVRRHTRVLRIELRAAPGASLELRLRRGARATAERPRCDVTGPAGIARCRLRRPQRGRWHASVLTVAADPAAPFAIGAKLRRARRYR